MGADIFIGIPFALGGRDFTGVDCYGLVRLWNQHVLGRELPEVAGYDTVPRALADIIERERGTETWCRVELPKPGDVVLLRVGGFPSHCGVVVGAGRFLHVSTGHHSRVEYLSDPVWTHRVLGFYRYGGDA